MRNSLIECGLYFSSSAFVVSILLESLEVNPRFWHSMAIALILIPLISIAMLLYKPKQQEEDFLSALKQKEEEPDKGQELVGSIFKWWVLRLMPVALAVELVFWGYL